MNSVVHINKQEYGCSLTINSIFAYPSSNYHREMRFYNE